MHTSVLLIALMGPGAAPAAEAPEAPRWQESYRAARTVGREAGKPLAVFIGSGPSGWEGLTEEGKLTRRLLRLLAENYVCVYVDTSKPAGQRLADAFDVHSGTGLVVSTYDGKDQAFWHAGTMSRSQLEETLQRHAIHRVIRRTERLDRGLYTALVYPEVSTRSVTQTIPAVYTPVINGFVPAAYTIPTMNYAPSFGGFRGGFTSGGC